jgi:UMF1 family MFS transporter
VAALGRLFGSAPFSRVHRVLQAGIQAVVALAAIYAQQAMGFTTAQTLVLVLVVNVTAAFGALVFGHVQDRIGHVRTIALTLIGWILAVVLAWLATGPQAFLDRGESRWRLSSVEPGRGRALVRISQPAHANGGVLRIVGLAVKIFPQFWAR